MREREERFLSSRVNIDFGIALPLDFISALSTGSASSYIERADQIPEITPSDLQRTGQRTHSGDLRNSDEIFTAGHRKRKRD